MLPDDFKNLGFAEDDTPKKISNQSGKPPEAERKEDGH
jgi:hypothetical protein